MIIQNSSVNMTGKSMYSESYKKQETLQVWVDSAPKPEKANLQNVDILDLSEQGKAIQSSVAEVSQTEEADSMISDKDKQKILMLEKMLEALTGKKIKFVIPEGFRLKNSDSLAGFSQGTSRANPQPKQGWGVIYTASEQYVQHESMSFSARGVVQTADGRKISLQVDLSLSRDFAYSNNISFRAGDAVKMVDPLVINMDVASADMTETKFAFDLDVDGNAENISFVGSGSGFLAFDQNTDGVINDGRELFGTGSGDGFADLAAYDSDNNGWIDENDPIYEKLRIWTKDEEGQDVLFALGQKGVGAIYLGSAATNYGLKGSSNQLNGEINKTGIYLNENGSVGTIQHVDIAV